MGASIAEELEMRAQQVMFQEDLEILDQYQQCQDILSFVDPLGDARFPFLQMPEIINGESLLY